MFDVLTLIRTSINVSAYYQETFEKRRTRLADEIEKRRKKENTTVRKYEKSKCVRNRRLEKNRKPFVRMRAKIIKRALENPMERRHMSQNATSRLSEKPLLGQGPSCCAAFNVGTFE